MKNVVLVSGALHGTWCWRKVEKILKDKGINVINIELPGSGKDTTPPQKATLDSYVEAVVSKVKGLDKFTLVGHGLGGVTISHVAEKLADKVEHLLYFSGILLPQGKSLTEMLSHNKDAELAKTIKMAGDKSHWTMTENDVKKTFYHDCDSDDFKYAKKFLTMTQSTQPENQSWKVTEEKFGAIPKYYVECLNDHAISLAFQRFMQHSWPLQRTYSLKTGHVPFFTATNEVAKIIKEVAFHHHHNHHEKMVAA